MKLWLRHEVKDNERRTPITPKNAQRLLEFGHSICVEESETRIFSTNEYEKIGCEIVKQGSWQNASKDTIIIGLKELPEDDFELVHQHIYFAHVFKGQSGYEKVLNRYKLGGGTLFDLEYLTDESKRRIAAFGKWAGYVGAALGVALYFDKKFKVKSFPNKEALINSIKQKISTKINSIIIGAKGRSGQGAVEAITDLGLKSTNLDYEETKGKSHFQEILDHDLFVNTVLMTKKIEPFLNLEMLQSPHKLRIISDVSCDPSSDLNPIPVYNSITSWDAPLEQVKGTDVFVQAIDNLPSILPKESSIDFSDQLIEHLINFEKQSTPWKNAKEEFLSHLR